MLDPQIRRRRAGNPAAVATGTTSVYGVLALPPETRLDLVAVLVELERIPSVAGRVNFQPTGVTYQIEPGSSPRIHGISVINDFIGRLGQFTLGADLTDAGHYSFVSAAGLRSAAMEPGLLEAAERVVATGSSRRPVQRSRARGTRAGLKAPGKTLERAEPAPAPLDLMPA